MSQEMMDVTGSLKKIARELLELKLSEMSYEEQQERLKAASWLIEYIASALDVELMHAAERGRREARKQLEEKPSYPVISLEG